MPTKDEVVAANIALQARFDKMAYDLGVYERQADEQAAERRISARLKEKYKLKTAHALYHQRLRDTEVWVCFLLSLAAFALAFWPLVFTKD